MSDIGPLIEWRREFELGIPSVDHEHRELVGLINELHAGLHRAGSEASTMHFLGELYARIASHFALEERLMREQGYDQLVEHKASHEALLDEIRDLTDAYEDGGFVDVDRFAASLDRWFSDHFRTHDARLHRRLG